MHFKTFLSAAALLSAANAAPRAAVEKNARVDDITERRDEQLYKAKYHQRSPHHDSDASAAERIVWRGQRHPHIHKNNSTLSSNLTTATSSAASGAVTYPSIPFVNTSLSSTVLADPTSSDCSFSVVTITTTVDYVETVTASISANSSAPPPQTHYANTTTSWFNWNTTSTVSSYLTGSAYPTVTEDPCPFENGTNHYATTNATATGYATVTASSSTVSDPPCDDETSTSAAASASPTATEPCDDETSTSASASATTTEPCDDDVTTTAAPEPTTTEPCDDDLTSTSSDEDGTTTIRATLSRVVTVVPIHAVTTSSDASSLDPATTTFTPTSTTTTCVIDTLITPITQATLTSTVTTTVTPTQTVCATNAPTGTPSKRNSHCGVHGKPVGDFFLARFVENAANVPVTLEGCYQFCNSVYGDTHGCLSYDYYLNELGAPRCDLYGSTVAYALDSIDNRQPNWWFDLTCGDPTAPKWSGLNIEASLEAELSVLGVEVTAGLGLGVSIN